MEKSRSTFLVIVVLILALAGAYIGTGYLDEPAGKDPAVNVSSSEAVSIVESNASANAYMNANFRVPDWGTVRTTLIDNTSGHQDKTVLPEADSIWKVEMMERTCACPGPSNLYVVEGYVNANNGDLIDVKTMKVPEKEYEKRTCASTSCH